MMRRGAVVVFMVWAGGGCGVAHAQVPGPFLPAGAVEIGAMYREVDRTLEYQQDEEDYFGNWWLAVARVGITQHMTASVELASGLGGIDIGDHSYGVGAEIRTRVWDHGRFLATTGIHYARNLVVYQSGAGCGDWLETRLDWNAVMQLPTTIGTQVVTFWAGPTLSFMAVTPQAPCVENTFESGRLIGGIGGASVVFMRHLALHAQATWVDALETSAVLAYRF